MNMGQLSDQLKEYLENTSPEQQENDWFNVCCTVEGIDPKDPDAKRKLNKINRKRKWESSIPSIDKIAIDIFISLLFMVSCIPLIAGKYLWFVVVYILGFLFLELRLYMEREKYE